MKIIAKFLTKILVQQFYIINAGFFLFGFFFFFGIVKGEMLIPYHRSLLLSIISSPLFTGVVCLAWMCYNLKCIQFCRNALTTTESNYIFILKALPGLRQFILYLLISTLQYLPVLIYSFFVVYIAFKKSLVLTGIFTALFQLLMVTAGASIIYNTINRNNRLHPLDKFLSKANSILSIRIGYFALLLSYFFSEKKIAFFVVKVFSILLLSVSFVRNGDDFDIDLFQIFFQVVLTAHAALVFYLVQFSESHLQFSRNLPLPLYKTAALHLFTFLVLLLPEVCFMLVNNHGNLAISSIIFQYLTAVIVLFLYTGILYGCGLEMESYMLFVFVSFIMNFFLQKTGQQFLAMLFILGIAMIIFKSHYYSFEKSLKQKD